MYKKKNIALVIPAYNEEKLLPPTLEGVPNSIDKVYVINDKSTDGTADVVRKMQKKDGRIELINHKKNLGPGNAIITGYKQVLKDNYDIAVVIGGDNQMDLADLPNFLDPIIRNEADYTKGNRFLLGGNAYVDMPKQRFFGNATLSFLTKFASGYWKIFDTQDGYTAITKETIARVDWNKVKVGYGYVSDFLVLLNLYNVHVKDVPRRAIYLKGERQSQINIVKYIFTVGPRLLRRFFWRLNTKYFYQSFHPLIFMYYLSLPLILAGLFLGIKIIVDAITGPVSGNQVVLTVLMLLLGFQFLFFSMLFDMQENAHLN